MHIHTHVYLVKMSIVIHEYVCYNNIKVKSPIHNKGAIKMNYPTLKGIFWGGDFRLESDPNIAELVRCTNGYLEKLVKKKHISDSEAERIGELAEELSNVSKAAGFEQGFRFAISLLL